MAINKKLVLFVVVVSVAGRTCGLPAPAPQVSNTIPGSSDTDSEDEYYYDDYYYEIDEDSGPPPLPDFSGVLGTIGQQIPGLIKLIQTKVAIINTILNNKEFQERIGETVQVGSNLLQRIVIPVASRALPIVIDLAGKVPDILAAGGNVLRAGQDAIGTLTRTPEFQQNSNVQTRSGSSAAAGSGVEMLASGTRVIGSLVKATNDTAPRVIKGLTEFDTLLPFVTEFAGSYVATNVKEAQQTAKQFHRSFNCDFECRGLTGRRKRRCEKKYCRSSEQKRNP